ncbi:MAG: hypothetical protein AUG49_25865 [Catenulispora sp. 13_1_20CM_3_70_7]|nr:MAG: hypothetical protein AUG49_25865 [Catenulispora sp. 13_1_20CM_3_70_7]
MLIQIILIATAFVLFVFFIRSSHSVRTQAVKRIGFVLFLVLNLDAVLRPDDTTWLANKVGVGRGADLVLYLLVVAFAFYSVNTFLRFRNLERRPNSPSTPRRPGCRFRRLARTRPSMPVTRRRSPR